MDNAEIHENKSFFGLKQINIAAVVINTERKQNEIMLSIYYLKWYNYSKMHISAVHTRIHKLIQLASSVEDYHILLMGGPD